MRPSKRSTNAQCSFINKKPQKERKGLFAYDLALFLCWMGVSLLAWLRPYIRLCHSLFLAISW